MAQATSSSQKALCMKKKKFITVHLSFSLSVNRSSLSFCEAVENICALAITILSLLLSTSVQFRLSRCLKESVLIVWNWVVSLKSLVKKNFTTHGVILFCKLCEVKITAEKCFTVQQHCDSAKHKSCVNREFVAESRQRLLFEKPHGSSSTSGSASEFSKDLCKMMVLSNIPLHKVEAASFRKFLEKYTTHPIPAKFTLRKNYLASCYDDTINKIRNSVWKKQNVGLHRWNQWRRWQIRDKCCGHS
jgi:hypothetical protein